MSDHEVPETENGIDLDDPVVVLFRRLNLEATAREQGETTRCPECGLLLPSTPMTWVKSDIGNGFYEWKRFCTICQIEF